MKNKADKVLAGVFGLFILAVLFKYFYQGWFWSELCFKVAEAALVGGIADWFAVTALFRRPLGFPYHTGLIPRNREKLIQSISTAVEEEFLSREALGRELGRIRFVSLLINWVEDRGGILPLISLAERDFRQILQGINGEKASQYLGDILKQQLNRLALSGYIAEIARWLLAERQDERWIHLLIADWKLAAATPAARQQIRFHIAQYAQEKTESSWWGRIFAPVLGALDIVNLDEAAETLQQQLVRELTMMEQPDHPLRQWLRQKLVLVVTELETNPQWQQDVDAWKMDILERIPFAEIVKRLLELGLHHVREESLHIDGYLAGRPATLEQALVLPGVSPLVAGLVWHMEKYWNLFRQDEIRQNWFEAYIQEALAQVVASEHRMIGELVKDALESLSDEELNAFVAAKVGDDLDWIRINGSLVGAIAGLMLFLLTYLYQLSRPLLVR
ncbi:DUF445 domain-containing protein [Acetonema longum]|uniref:DUF445 domain-containing protein n=1 Tax=Acetonema longum DSM 6540 TaxID=1009370 RepID=F7NFZ4_9FIRM|nr:DUF445 domain-containing protein [Acetonema longum]EGO65057.1 hypothetical protein ALO_04888 [Acetonema longum DSM 6540]